MVDKFVLWALKRRAESNSSPGTVIQKMNKAIHLLQPKWALQPLRRYRWLLWDLFQSVSVTRSWPKPRLDYLPCAWLLSSSQAGGLPWSGVRQVFDLVLATCGALLCNGFEMFCFYPNLATFCKCGIFGFVGRSLGVQAIVYWDLMFCPFLSFAFFLEICRHDFPSSAGAHSSSLDWVDLRQLWDTQPFHLIESHFLVLVQSCLFPCFAFPRNPSFDVRPNISKNTDVLLEPTSQPGPVKVIGVCCVFCTHLHNAVKLPLLRKQGFLEGIMCSRWVVSSHHAHVKKTCMWTFCPSCRLLARLRLPFEEQLYALFGLNILSLLICELMTFCYHCIWVAQHRG